MFPGVAFFFSSFANLSPTALRQKMLVEGAPQAAAG